MCREERFGAAPGAGARRHLRRGRAGAWSRRPAAGWRRATADGLRRHTRRPACRRCGRRHRTGRGQAAQACSPAAPPAPCGDALPLAGGLRVVADERNNAILVYGTAAQFERIEEALHRLDLPPTQVLIEASIVEVTLTDETSYGLQWTFGDTRASGGTGTSVLSGVAGGARRTAGGLLLPCATASATYARCSTRWPRSRSCA
ncbi:hypothetical protein MASR1M6_27080 [Rubrivivax sp.]